MTKLSRDFGRHDRVELAVSDEIQQTLGSQQARGNYLQLDGFPSRAPELRVPGGGRAAARSGAGAYG